MGMQWWQRLCFICGNIFSFQPSAWNTAGAQAMRCLISWQTLLVYNAPDTVAFFSVPWISLASAVSLWNCSSCGWSAISHNFLCPNWPPFCCLSASLMVRQCVSSAMCCFYTHIHTRGHTHLHTHGHTHTQLSSKWESFSRPKFYMWFSGPMMGNHKALLGRLHGGSRKMNAIALALQFLIFFWREFVVKDLA